MSSTSEPSRPETLDVRDLLALSYAELSQLMQKRRNPDTGKIVIDIDGWENLSKDERSQLVEKLKAAQGQMHSSRLDLDELDARLNELLANNVNTASRRRTIQTSRSPTESVDFEVENRIDETEAYQKLVDHGGRPLYPIGLLEEVSTHAEKYHEMLQSWQYPSDLMKTWEVFQRQWGRWNSFRKWQRDNRDLEDDCGGFPAYVERSKHHAWRRYTKKGYAEWLLEAETDPSFFDLGWKNTQLQRHELRCSNKKRGSEGSSDYADAMRKRLVRHGFTRPFQLREDPNQQDSLTTWIEYINFEYMLLDDYTNDVKRLGAAREKAWQELVDSNILLPHETIESVVHDGMENEAEFQAAFAPLERARLEVDRIDAMAQSDAGRDDIPEMRRAAVAAELAAEERFQQTRARLSRVASFVRGTFGYRSTKVNIVNQRKRLRWILEQIPLIEAEMIQSKTTDARSDAAKSRDGRLTSTGDRSAQGHNQNRLGLGQFQGNSAVEAHSSVDLADDDDQPVSRGEAQELRSRQSLDRRSHRPMDASGTMGPSSQRSRRSTRIAASRGTLSPAVAPPPSRKQPRPRPRAKASKAPTGHHPRTRRTKKSPQSVQTSAIGQPLRRSARIAAQRERANAAALLSRAV